MRRVYNAFGEAGPLKSLSPRAKIYPLGSDEPRTVAFDDDPSQDAALASIVVAMRPVHRRAVVDDYPPAAISTSESQNVGPLPMSPRRSLVRALTLAPPYFRFVESGPPASSVERRRGLEWLILGERRG